MKIRAALPLSVSLFIGALLSGCAYIQHVPPGQSLSAAMAKKAELVALPAPPPQPPPVALAQAELPQPAAATGPILPAEQTEEVADDYTLGNLCLQQGRYNDAITAYGKAVQRDPTFADAWNKLALAYQDAGQEDKAVEAFKKYKMVAEH